MKKSLLNILLVVCTAGYLTACGNNGNNGNNAAVAAANSCGAGQVLSQGYGCTQQCPYNPQMGYVNGQCVQAVVNTAACTQPGYVPTAQGCQVQCTYNPSMAGPSCNIPVTYNSSSSYGYGYGYSGYNGYNSGYQYGTTGVNPYGGYNPYQGYFSPYSNNYGIYGYIY